MNELDCIPFQIGIWVIIIHLMDHQHNLTSFGSREDIEYRLFKVTLWVTIAVFGIWFLIAFLADYTLIIKLTYGTCFVIYSGLLIAFYKGASLNILATIFYTLISIIAVYTWLPAGGITGVIQIMLIMVFVSGLLVLPLPAYKFFIFFSVILVGVYFVVELLYEDIAASYSSEISRIRDFGIAGIIAMISIGVALYMFKKEHANDRERLRKTITELEVEKEKATAADRAKSEFLAVISHEMRTPLNGVVGLTELLSETELNKEQQEMIKNLSFSSGMLNSLISDILDLSLIESGKIVLNESMFSCHEEIMRSIDLISPKLKKKKAKIELTYINDESIPGELNGDVARYRQVLINLLSNAVKYTDEGEIVVSTRKLDQKEDRVTIRTEVKDTGRGIPRERQKQLFTKFYKASYNPNIEGTGLGLSISKQLVELMGGKIGFDSTLGEGSVFYFELPFKIVKSEGKSEHDDVELSLNGLKVLIAEDVKVNQMVIRKMIQKYDPEEIMIAENGKIALQKAEEKIYDIILMDVQMPEMNGIEAAHQISEKYKRKGHSPLIIAISANAMKEDIEAYRNVGMNEYLTKPVTINALGSVLRKYF
jgi:signal transduction histidine kinase/ActR/RegA family two-component response regulator